MRLNFLYTHTRRTGYGRMGSDLNVALENIGVETFDDLPAPGKTGTIAPAATWMCTPGHVPGWYKGQHVSILTMFEATRLPEVFRESLDNFDLIMVPSRQNLELFSRYHQNVKLVPLGIDPAYWYPTDRVPVKGYFDFLTAGSGLRKGTDLVLKAFHRVFGPVAKPLFTGGPMPRLTIKSPKGGNVNRPDVVAINGFISDQMEVALYERAHCYVQASRGEGFGLQPLQALAQGIPTVLTAAHGHEAFADLGVGIGSELVPSSGFHYGNAGDWWEPDFEELCAAMEDVYRNYAEHLRRAQRNALVVADQFTWEAAAHRVVEAIGSDVLALPDPKPENWTVPVLRQYLVRVQRHHEMHAAGVDYFFDPGIDYHECADVKRILYDAGFLDPSCVDMGGEDTGLTPGQIESAGAYSAQHAMCPTCHQRLNTNVVPDDEILELAEVQ